MSGYIMTVDTGGSKTQITLFSSNGNKLNETRCIGIGVTNEANAQLDILKKAIEDIVPKENFSDIEKIVINVGGKNTDQIRGLFETLFPGASVETYRESSGVIMRALCESYNADAILMAGTGSIALSNGLNGSIITDGWCPNVGDFGSGYWIGLEAISRSVKALENNSKLTPLVKYITGKEEPFSAFMDTTEQMLIRDEIRSRFMPLERAEVAKITKVAAGFAREGDTMAKEIFNDAGVELAKTVIRGLDIAKCSDDAKILVSGGLIGCFDLWGAAFEETLNKENKNYTYFIGESDMTRGALCYALHNIKRRD